METLIHGDTKVFYNNASNFKGGPQIFVFEKCIEMVNRFWPTSSDTYLLSAYYVSNKCRCQPGGRKRKPSNYKTIGSMSGTMAKTQASQISFHVISLLLMHFYTMPLCLNTILILLSTFIALMRFQMDWKLPLPVEPSTNINSIIILRNAWTLRR